jgi:uncharacterized protein
MKIETFRILILGGGHVGKISFAGQIGEREYVSGGLNNPARMPPLRRMDMRRLTLREDLFCYFFSANYRHPMLDILLEGMAGFFLLIDSTNPHSMYEDQAILKYLTLLDPVPHIIVANKQDREDAMTVGQIRREMELTAETLILPCVATERASVANVLNTLLPMIRPDIQDRIR